MGGASQRRVMRVLDGENNYEVDYVWQEHDELACLSIDSTDDAIERYIECVRLKYLLEWTDYLERFYD